jgi:hypothetical protein
MEVKLLTFLISALHGGEWVASHFICITPQEELQYSLNKRLDGSRNHFEDSDGKEQNPCSYWEWNCS